MKYETLMLHGLMIICMAVCSLVLAAMLRDPSRTIRPVGNNHYVTLLTAAPASCALPADGVICPQPLLRG